MEEKAFSKILQKLRKEAGMTQEQLANMLGVSAQAVSKWENGSYPEGDLLPKLADCFDVSIDNLYGRGEEKVSIEQQVVNAIHSIWTNKYEENISMQANMYSDLVHRLLWATNISAWTSNEYYYDVPLTEESIGKMASVVTTNYSYDYMGLNKGKEFYVYLKDNENEGGLNRFLDHSEEIRKLFGMLADKDCVDILRYLYSLNEMQFADTEAISNATGVSNEKTQSILDYLVSELGKFGGQKTLKSILLVKKNDKDQKAYAANVTLGGLFIALFAIADCYVYTPHGFSMQVGNRNKPLLKEDKQTSETNKDGKKGSK